MKKYLALFLIALVLFAFLVSCSTPQSGNDVVSSDSGATQDSSKQSHTIGDCSMSDSSHLPSAPPQDNSTTNSSIQNPDVPTEKINTVTWQFTYDYGFHHTDVVTLLVDYGYLRGDFEWIVIPNDIVAGDTITINYTGDYIIQETYPGKIMLDGEVISYSFSYANVIAMRAESLTAEMLLEYDAPNNYIILDRGGRYTTLDKYEGDVVYLVEDQRTVRPRTEDMPFYVACMLAYNPRDLQDGIPEYENPIWCRCNFAFNGQNVDCRRLCGVNG